MFLAGSKPHIVGVFDSKEDAAKYLAPRLREKVDEFFEAMRGVLPLPEAMAPTLAVRLLLQHEQYVKAWEFHLDLCLRWGLKDYTYFIETYPSFHDNKSR